MKHRSATRVVALTTLTCLLLAFAMPALAAPGGGTDGAGLSSPASIVQWLQSLWTGWLGAGGDAGEPSVEAEPSSPVSFHAQLGSRTEPDGVAVTSTDLPTGGDAPTESDSTDDGTL